MAKDLYYSIRTNKEDLEKWNIMAAWSMVPKSSLFGIAVNILWDKFTKEGYVIEKYEGKDKDGRIPALDQRTTTTSSPYIGDTNRIK